MGSRFLSIRKVFGKFHKFWINQKIFYRLWPIWQILCLLDKSLSLLMWPRKRAFSHFWCLHSTRIYDFSTKLCKIRSKLTFLLRHTLCVHGVIKLLDSLAFIASVEALLKVTSTSQDYGHHCWSDPMPWRFMVSKSLLLRIGGWHLNFFFKYITFMY